jgi:hypothetical protein
MASAIEEFAARTGSYSKKRLRKNGVPYVVLVVRPAGGTFEFRQEDLDIAYGMVDRRPLAPYFEVKEAAFQPDGKWHSARLDLTKTFELLAPRFRPRRILLMRLIGEADLDDIAIEE